jgi:hypothetical protein
VVVYTNEILPHKRGGVSDGNLESSTVSGKDLPQQVRDQASKLKKRDSVSKEARHRAKRLATPNAQGM